MSSLRFTLLADGSSDRVLLVILNWMLGRHHPKVLWTGQAAELHRLPQPPKGLKERIAMSLELFPADVLFVHRDAEREPAANRHEEIERAIAEIGPEKLPPCVAVIPVRMTEAWLLISEKAIRGAAGNPNGKNALCLPAVKKLEELPDPKAVLNDLLLEASELNGRRRKKFSFSHHRSRVPDFIDDWSIILRIASAAAVDRFISQLVLTGVQPDREDFGDAFDR